MCFFNEQKEFSENGKFGWPGDINDAISCLNDIPYVTNTIPIIEKHFSDKTFGVILILWDLETLAKSSLHFYLKTAVHQRKETNRSLFNWYDWVYITPSILNENTSKGVLNFIQTSYGCPEKLKIFGVKFSIRSFMSYSDFNLKLKMSPKSLDNLLNLLKIDQLSREFLIQRTFKDKNFNQLVEFLSIYECSLNKNLVLTKALIFYTKGIKNKTLSFKKIDVQEYINELFELTRIELENFDVIDIFESAEQYKSGVYKINFFSYNKKLLLDLTNDPGEDSIQIFELFELFMYSTKKQTLLWTKISLQAGSAFLECLHARAKPLILCEAQA